MNAVKQSKSKRKQSLDPETWVKPSELLEAFNLSRNKLQRLRQEGTLKNGVHWVDINPNSTPRYRYNYERCKETLVSLRRKSDATQ